MQSIFEIAFTFITILQLLESSMNLIIEEFSIEIDSPVNYRSPKAVFTPLTEPTFMQGSSIFFGDRHSFPIGQSRII